MHLTRCFRRKALIKNMNENLLVIEGLTVTAGNFGSKKKLLDNISLTVPKKSIVGLVGESGSGKTTTGLSILNLLPAGLTIDKGAIYLNNEKLLNKSPSQMRKIRGKEISMIFQEPLNAFNPVFTIGFQVDEVLKIHTSLDTKGRQKRVHELLEITGLDNPERAALSYPHQLSGGMRQRAMVAQAIAGDPKLIIADEPTSSLDVTLQAKIIDLFRSLTDQLGLSILLITHDLGMVRSVSSYVHVMKEGKVVESGETEQTLNRPQDDYTKQLIQAF